MSTFEISKYPNDLTLRLVAQGYTPDNHPDHVQWRDGPREFEYTYTFIRDRVYEAPCGLLWKDEHDGHGEMGYNGVSWCHENDNPTIRCPYIPAKFDCPLMDDRLRDLRGSAAGGQCAMKPTDKPYDKDNSIAAVKERQEAMDEARSRRAMAEFSKIIRAKIGFFCPRHAVWKMDTSEWIYLYDYYPHTCPNYCRTQPCLRCGIRDDGKEGNVLYDVHVYRRRADNSMFDDVWDENITRGYKFFEHPMRLAICQMVIDRPKLIHDKVRGSRQYARDLYFEEYHWHGRYRLEIENIRIVEKGKKDVRNLLDDLQATKEGISVSHESDLQKAAAEQKRMNREKSKGAKIVRLEKQVLTNYDGIEEYQKKIITKKLGNQRVQELLIQAARKKQVTKPEQLSLF